MNGTASPHPPGHVTPTLSRHGDCCHRAAGLHITHGARPRFNYIQINWRCERDVLRLCPFQFEWHSNCV